MPGIPGGVRLDKWLWAARFFKTRGLAQQAVEGGKVKLNGERPKPAKEVKVGDRLVIRVAESEWAVTVAALGERRGPAEQARQLYQESDESRARRQEQSAARKLLAPLPPATKGRPTKRDRRRMERLVRGE
jgi:ribosome-associated heat shock protein Hsp15